MIRPARPFVVLAATAVLAAAAVTWAVADLVYDLGQPRCVSGRRVTTCGGDRGWHDVSGIVSSLVAVPSLMLLVGTYLFQSSRLVRAAKAKRRDELRSALRRRFGLVLLAAVAVTVPLTLAVRAAL